MQGKVEICGVNTSKLKTLRQEEMSRLLRQAREGDQSARDRVVEGNLRLVLSVTQRFMGRGENPDDLFQVGCIGLLKAVQNFDSTKEVRFSTYGVPMAYHRSISPERTKYDKENRPAGSRQNHRGKPDWKAEKGGCDQGAGAVHPGAAIREMV